MKSQDIYILLKLVCLQQELLVRHGSVKLKLKESKTHITKLGNKVKILGLVVLPNGHITIDGKYKEKINALVFEIKSLLVSPCS